VNPAFLFFYFFILILVLCVLEMNHTERSRATAGKNEYLDRQHDQTMKRERDHTVLSLLIIGTRVVHPVKVLIF
jgi:hypothetical protein